MQYLPRLADWVDSRRTAEEVQLLQTVTHAINASLDFPTALQETLQQVCEMTQWDYGEAWIPDQQAQVLRASSSWYAKPGPLEQLRQYSANITFAPGVGLPGRVWVSKQPEWDRDLSCLSPQQFLRFRVAQELGFRSGIGIPISHQGEVLAVLAFFMVSARPEDQRWIEVVTTIATQLSGLMQRKQTEVALQRSEDINRVLLEAIPDLVVQMTRDGYYLNCVPAKNFRPLLPSEGINGKHIREVLPEPLVQERMQYVEQALRTGQVQTHEYSILLNDQICYREARIAVSSADEVLVIVRDVTQKKQGELALKQSHEVLEQRVAVRTAELQQMNAQLQQEIRERRQVEAELRKSQQMLQLVIDNMPLSIFWKDRNLVYLGCNQVFADWVGVRSPQAVIGKTDFDLPAFTPEMADYYRECDRRVLETNQAETHVAEFQANVQGRELWVERQKIPICDAVGQVMGVLGTLQDVSQRKEAESQMVQALDKERELHQLKSDFISVVSHEFRTPLSVIKNSATLLEHYGDRIPTDQQENYWQHIQTAIRTIVQLLDDVLVVGKAESGRLEFSPSPLDVLTFCQELLAMVQMSEYCYHHLQLQHAGQPHSLPVDQQLLRYVLINLLSNALKYSPSGTTVELAVIFTDTKLIFQVSDKGMGISPEDQQHLFKPFYRTKTVGNIPGTGLGLAIAKQCVELHGGTIQVASQVNLGTTFTVELPIRATDLSH